MLWKLAVVYSHGEADGVCISSLVEAVLKSKRQQIFPVTRGEDPTQCPGLCRTGKLKDFR